MDLDVKRLTSKRFAPSLSYIPVDASQFQKCVMCGDEYALFYCPETGEALCKRCRLNNDEARQRGVWEGSTSK